MATEEETTQYAETYWTIEDVLSLAIDVDATLTEDEAHGILYNAENRLKDAMVERGWDVLNTYFSDFLEERK
jgi:hypothetical protein